MTKLKKSRKRETKHPLTDADSSNDTKKKLREVGAKRRLNSTLKVNRWTDRRKTDGHTDGQFDL